MEKHGIAVWDTKGMLLHVAEGTASRGRCDGDKKMKTQLKGAPLIKK